MLTVAEPLVWSGVEATPFPIVSEMFIRMIEQGLFGRDQRVFLWDGTLYEKMAKSKAHAAVQTAFLGALAPASAEPFRRRGESLSDSTPPTSPCPT